MEYPILSLNYKEIIDLIYPIGSVYITFNDSNPALLFGGTWESISGKFLLGTDNVYSVESVGGEAAHTLTQAELPRIVCETNLGGSGNGYNQYTGTPVVLHYQTPGTGAWPPTVVLPGGGARTIICHPILQLICGGEQHNGITNNFNFA